MDLNEAIQHCLDVAKRNSKGIYDAVYLGGMNISQKEIDDRLQCAEEHRQLAEWLTELKERRKNDKKSNNRFAI